MFQHDISRISCVTHMSLEWIDEHKTSIWQMVAIPNLRRKIGSQYENNHWCEFLALKLAIFN